MKNFKKKLFVLCLLLISNLVIAQFPENLTISESAEYQDKVKSTNILAIYTSESLETIVVRGAKEDFLFDTFDESLNKTFSKVIKSSKKEEHVGDLFYNNQLKLFTVYAPNKDERIVYCHSLDLKSKRYNKKVVFETIVDKKQSLFGSRKRHNTNFALSSNVNYFAIATDNVKKDKNSYTIRVFDAKTEELLYKQAYQENEKLFYDHQDLYIDNNANVYSLGRLFTYGFKERDYKGDANYNYVLNKLNKEGTQDLVIDLEDDHVQSLNIIEVNNQLHLLGFYSELNKNRVKGGCNFIIDTHDLSVKAKKSFNLPAQVYKDLYGYRDAKRKNKKNKELRNFEIDYVLKDNKGGAYLIAEEFYITQTYSQTGTMGVSQMQTVYHYDDLLILKFNSEGKLDWGRSVFKRAFKPSYNAFLKDDHLHIILNSGKNLTQKSDDRVKVSKGRLESTALYDFDFDIAGDVTYYKIQNNKGKSFYLPHYGTYEKSRFIMMSSERKKKTFMILK